MGETPAAADDKLPAFVANFRQVRLQHAIEFGLAALLITTRLAPGGSEQAADAHVGIIGLDIAALHVKIAESQASHDRLWQGLAVKRHAALLALDGIKKVGVVLRGGKYVCLQVILPAAHILDANEIGILVPDPVKKTFISRTLDAVSAQTDNSHRAPYTGPPVPGGLS